MPKNNVHGQTIKQRLKCPVIFIVRICGFKLWSPANKRQAWYTIVSWNL